MLRLGTIVLISATLLTWSGHVDSRPQSPYNYNPPQAQSQANPYYYNAPSSNVNHLSSYETSGSHVTSEASLHGAHAQQQQYRNDVFKHLYFFESPEDEIELPAPRLKYARAQGKGTHHKIIFIKAPSYRVAAPQIVGDVGGADSDEKTVIYVLSKKPNPQRDVVINTGAGGHKVHKPEVYYIKYDTKEDAEQQIRDKLHGGGNTGGDAAHSVDSDREFVSTIRDNEDVRAQGPIVKNIGDVNAHAQVDSGAQIYGNAGAPTASGAGVGYSSVQSGASSSSYGGQQGYVYNNHK